MDECAENVEKTVSGGPGESEESKEVEKEAEEQQEEEVKENLFS